MEHLGCASCAAACIPWRPARRSKSEWRPLELKSVPAQATRKFPNGGAFICRRSARARGR
eukprot:11512457-Alexandrium_andersonii.AAC.1